MRRLIQNLADGARYLSPQLSNLASFVIPLQVEKKAENSPNLIFELVSDVRLEPTSPRSFNRHRRQCPAQ